MKKIFIFGLIIGLFGLGSVIFAGNNTKPQGNIYRVSEHLDLFKKDSNWGIVEDGAWGKLNYSPEGNEFSFVFNGHKLNAEEDYTLIYYPDPWPGNGLKCLGKNTSNKGGNVHIMGSYDTGNLPIDNDENEGAKIWLVLSSDVSCPEKKMEGWNPDEYLFENELISFDAESSQLQ